MNKLRIRHDGTTTLPYHVEEGKPIFFGLFRKWTRVNYYNSLEEAEQSAKNYIQNAVGAENRKKRIIKQIEDAKKLKGVIKYIDTEHLKGEITA